MYLASGEGRIINSRFHKKSMEIVELTHGSAQIFIGTQSYEAEKGDIIYIPPEMVFRAESVNGSASMRGMIFDREVLESNMQTYESDVLYMFYVQSLNKTAVFKSEHPIYGVISSAIAAAYEEYMAKDVCYMLPIRANIYTIMTELLRYYCGTKNEEERVIYHNVMRLRPIINYINENFDKKIYVEMLADIIAVSADYFTKMFKDSIGKTPIDYINAIRVNRAMQILKSTDKPMGEVGEAVGFPNPNYFHKIFKQYMGTSPLAYRKATK